MATTESEIKAHRSPDATTIAQAFRYTAGRLGEQVAIRTKGDETTVTWNELRQRADAVAGGLDGLGLKHGDTIALLLSNRPEFHICDLAAMTIGATAFSIYTTYAPNQIEFVVSDAGARIAITEQALMGNLLEARESLPDLEHVIVIDGDAPDGCLSLAEIEGSAPEFDVDASVAAIAADDVITLIYTSGTTGPPKGVELTHGNLLAACEGVDAMVSFPAGGRVISWLPSAHIAERNAHHYLPIVYGLQVTCCDDPRAVLSYLPEVRPSWFFAVPRIWEKLKAGLDTMTAGLPEAQREATERALALSVERVRLQQRGDDVPDEMEAAFATADEQIFSKLRVQLGLDAVEVVNVGAAPTPVEVLEFFHAIGVPLAEIWGMSETCGAGTANPPDAIKIGTVGTAAPGVEIKLASDGEVMLRGGVVMRGYRNLPDKTAETIDGEGWLATGDIGRLDEDGYLKIVDRKKEIIINAAGKNMSPANIEATLKSASPLIGQAVVIGDARSYNTALIVLDADFAPVWAKQNGMDGKFDDLAGEEAIREAIQAGVDEANAKLARVEQIKKFTIVRGDWLPGGDELTPTMKLKRKPIAEKYDGEIEAMYAR